MAGDIRAQATELAILARELILERRAALLQLHDLIAQAIELFLVRALATRARRAVGEDVAHVLIVAGVIAFLPDLVLAGWKLAVIVVVARVILLPWTAIIAAVVVVVGCCAGYPPEGWLPR